MRLGLGLGVGIGVGTYPAANGAGGWTPYILPNLAADYDTSKASSLTTTTANFTGTGTATSTVVSTAFVGVLTAFLSELAPGDTVYNGSAVLIGTILSVTNDTNAVLTANGAAAITGAAFQIKKLNPRVSSFANSGGGVGTALVQATAGAMPTLGATGLLFDGANDYLKSAPFTLNQPETVYFVGQQVTWTGGRYFWDGNTQDVGRVVQTNLTPQLRAFAGISSGLVGAMALGTNAVQCVVFNGASSLFRINRLAPDTGNYGASNMGGFTVGSHGGVGGFGNIIMKEVLIFSASHDTATQNLVVGYLGTKWGIAV